MILPLFFLIFLIIGLGVFYYFYNNYMNTKNHLDNLLKNSPVLGKMVPEGSQPSPSCVATGGGAAICTAATLSPSQQVIRQNNIKIDWENSLKILDYYTDIYNDYVVLNDTANINKMKLNITELINYMKDRGYTNHYGGPIITPF